MDLSVRRLTPSETPAGLLPVVGLAAIILVLYFGRVFFITFVAAVIIAFILEPFVGLLMKLRMPRSLASFVVCSLGLLVVYLMGLGAYSQAQGLLEDYQTNYGQRIGEMIDQIRTRVEGMERTVYQVIVPARQQQQKQQELQQGAQSTRKRGRKTPDPAPQPDVPPPIQEVRIHSDRTPLSEYVYDRLSSLYQVFLMASFVPFLVYFMLSWRDHIYRSFLQFFHGEDRAVAAKSLQGIADMVRAFVVGNFVLGLLLAVASSLAFWKLGLPYPLLVGPLSGFMSLVPYIGLPLALAPPLLVTLASLGGLPAVLVVAAIVALLHVVALNLLYPKLVGSRVHLNPLVVTVALMFWGFLWDAAGLVLAIPLTAGIKAVCDNVKSLRPFGKFLGD